MTACFFFLLEGATLILLDRKNTKDPDVPIIEPFKN